ncbi:transferrin-binding protein-like solute binding protein, partial [Neisseria sp. P0007.S010]
MKESFKLSMLAIACSIALSACGSSGGGTPSAQPAPIPQQPGNNSGSGGGGDSKQTEDAKKAE